MPASFPENLKYASTHEWAKLENDGSVRIGITDHAQHLLGDLVYVELPKLNQAVTAGKECCVVESVKSASDVYSPLSGKVIAINETLSSQPELVNQSPYENGWLFVLQPSDATALQQLLSASDYQEKIAHE